ncbi:MAG: histidinol-phosphatase HisJ [archaeon]
MKANYHTHTTGSDGKLQPGDLIKLAIKKKFKVLGITDHYHIPAGFRNPSNEMYSYYSDEHYSELCKLKKKYRDKIKILVNVEFDWIGDYKKWLKKEAIRRKYDLRYISVHYIKMKKGYVPLDWTEKGFQEMIKDFGSVKKLVRWYYSSLRKAIKMNCFDVVAHIDLIKIWNKDKKYFSGDEEWYKKEVSKTLKLIKKMKMKIDLNSSGLKKPCSEQYPSSKILMEAKKIGISFLIGSDAHNSGELENGLEKVGKLI